MALTPAEVQARLERVRLAVATLHELQQHLIDFGQLVDDIHKDLDRGAKAFLREEKRLESGKQPKLGKLTLDLAPKVLEESKGHLAAAQALLSEVILGRIAELPGVLPEE